MRQRIYICDMDFYKRQVPAKLYKYLGPARVDVLTASRVRYTPLGDFNDPFEGWPEVTSLGNEKEISDVIDAVLPEEARRAYEQLDRRAQEMIPFADWFKVVKKLALENKPQMLSQFPALLPHAGQWIRSRFDQHIGAFCLSEVPDSLLMWAHYANSHTGFVIEYDAHHPYFHQQVSSDDELRHLRRVLYREARPSMPAAQLSSSLVFFTKSGHWSYESEWRVLRPLEDASDLIPATPAIHLFKVPSDAVTAVILGCRCSPETARAIEQAMAGNPAYSKAILRRARADTSHFLLRIDNPLG